MPGFNPWGSMDSQQGPQNFTGLGGVGSQNYPSYPNPAGAGNQQGTGSHYSPMSSPQMPAPVMQGFGATGNPVMSSPSSSSQSFNPWSLTGEAISRVP